MKDLLKLLFFVFPLPFAALFADCNSCPPPPPAETTGCCFETSASTSHAPEHEITPSAAPHVACSADLFFTADFIWWRAEEDGLAYASSEAMRTENVTQGKVYNPGFDWNPGFKVGAGMTLGRDGWDIFAEYTWYRSNNHSSASRKNDANSLLPYWPPDIFRWAPPNVFTNASGKWNLHFNVVDLELGRNFFISKYLTLRPFIGLKGTWQEQEYRANYTFLDEELATNLIFSKQKMDYWGIGTRAGLDTAWLFTRSFGLFADLSLTALWTDFDIKRKDQLESTTTPIYTTLQTRNDLHTVKPVLEFALGLRYETWWCEDDYHFSIQAGWEEQIWWSFNNLFRAEETVAHGDLTLHGLTIKARFDF